MTARRRLRAVPSDAAERHPRQRERATQPGAVQTATLPGEWHLELPKVGDRPTRTRPWRWSPGGLSGDGARRARQVVLRRFDATAWISEVDRLLAGALRPARAGGRPAGALVTEIRPRDRPTTAPRSPRCAAPGPRRTPASRSTTRRFEEPVRGSGSSASTTSGSPGSPRRRPSRSAMLNLLVFTRMPFPLDADTPRPTQWGYLANCYVVAGTATRPRRRAARRLHGVRRRARLRPDRAEPERAVGAVLRRAGLRARPASLMVRPGRRLSSRAGPRRTPAGRRTAAERRPAAAPSAEQHQQRDGPAAGGVVQQPDRERADRGEQVAGGLGEADSAAVPVGRPRAQPDQGQDQRERARCRRRRAPPTARARSCGATIRPTYPIG